MLSTREMSQSGNQLAAEYYAVENRPIEYLTENGFSIIRLCDIDDSIQAFGFVHRFLVRDPDGFEVEITVEIAENLAQDVYMRSRGRSTWDSSYWINCAERHLAEYLWENGDYPPDENLTVTELSLHDLNLARRWGKSWQC
jgi:hypothetical protein